MAGRDAMQITNKHSVHERRFAPQTPETMKMTKMASGAHAKTLFAKDPILAPPSFVDVNVLLSQELKKNPKRETLAGSCGQIFESRNFTQALEALKTSLCSSR